MRWRKHGLVWGPDGSLPWARSHATCPTPIVLADGRLRVFVQCRDAGRVGRVGWVDLDGDDPRRVVDWAREPALDVGAPGHFDDNGVFPTSVLEMPDGSLRMYYVGFELCHHIRYRLLTGLAVSDDGGQKFRRWCRTPVLERSSAEPHFRSGAWVLRWGDGFRMWYVAGGRWEVLDGKPMPVYDIRHLASPDGLTWGDEGEVVLPINPAREHGFGRPYVRRDGAHWAMHYSVRRRDPVRYRLGWARSHDGLHWQREDDRLGMDVSPGSWDGDSIEYAAEIDAGGRRWLLYNGDDFGAAGFGIAEYLGD